MRRTTMAAAAAAIAVIATTMAGCASRGYVRGQSNDVRSEMRAADESLRGEIARVDGAARAAGSEAASARDVAERARLLALGGVTFREIERATVSFEFESAELTEPARAALEDVASLVARRPDCIVELFGYTDSTGPSDYNDELSRRRAASVQRFLLDRAGGPISRFALVGLGETDLVTGSGSAEDRRASRRVVVSVAEPIDPTAAPSAGQQRISQRGE